MQTIKKELSNFKKEFDILLKEYLQQKLTKCREFDTHLVFYQEHLNRMMLSGGKRIRPFLFYRAHTMLGGKSKTEALKLSLALEFLQTFALIHDDIMDNSSLRRGEPTIHKAIEEETKLSLGQSPALHFGQSQAILLGDLAYSYCMEIIGSIHESTDARPCVSTKSINQFMDTFHTMTEEVIWGQQLDIIAGTFPAFDTELQEKIMLFKSGYYSIARPLQLGAILAGASPQALAMLEQIGANLGIAFQIRDDILGISGNEKTIGKSAISDILEKKITLPLLEAYHSTENNRKLIETTYRKKSITIAEAKKIKAAINTPEVLEAVNRKIQQKMDDTLPLIDKLPVDPKEKEFLKGFAEYLVNREK
ncbi:MAG: polyprenyl synthetase family protein [Candidatus Margulisiibacteriota bacterium]